MTDISITRLMELHPKIRKQQLYDQGRKTTGPIVTNARPGLSYHNYGLAVDYALIIDGKSISWQFNVDFDNDTKADFMEIVQVHKEFGWIWGGEFKTIIDKPHFEKSLGYSVRQLLALHEKKVFIINNDKYVLL